MRMGSCNFYKKMKFSIAKSVDRNYFIKVFNKV